MGWYRIDKREWLLEVIDKRNQSSGNQAMETKPLDIYKNVAGQNNID